MILKLNIDKDDLLLWAKYQQYEPSSKDLTKEEMATEFVIGELKKAIKHARIKQAKNAIVVEEPEVTGA